MRTNFFYELKIAAFFLLCYKILRKCYKVFLIVFALPMVILLRILKPWVIIRLGQIDPVRIGHFYAIEVYLSEREKRLQPQSTLDFFYGLFNQTSTSNIQLLTMWKRSVHIFPCGQYAYFVDWINRKLPGFEDHVISVQQQSKDHPDPSINDNPKSQLYFYQPTFVSSLLLSTSPHFQFNPQEIENGENALKKMGLSQNSPFVCFHARDSAYLKELYPHLNMSYHDYRDSNIHNYLLAAKELVNRDYFAIRVGSIANPLVTTHDKIIDYANQFHTDLMDLYLAYKCQFFISSCSGINVLPLFFRKPTLTVNVAHFLNVPSWSGKDFFIPKKFWLRHEKRFMRFGEVCQIEQRNLDTDYFRKSGIDLIENTPEELRDAAIEMDERVKESWKDNPEDLELQECFWKIITTNGIYKPPQLRIGAEFLRQNQGLL